MGTSGCKWLCGRACRCCWSAVLVVAYINVLWHLQRSYFWCWAYDWGARCKYPALPANQTGLKVLVAGWGKTGTWAMSKSLRLVFNNSYHSEEFMVHVWDRLAEEHWARPENGARTPRVMHPLLLDYYARKEWERTGVLPTPDLGLPAQGLAIPTDDALRFPNDDLMVLKDLKREKLAAYTSQCRADTLAFDGIDRLYWPLFEMSPGVKVISLDWRSYESWIKSVERFFPRWMMLTLSTNVLYSSVHGLPWGILLKQIDPWIGGPVREVLQDGKAFLHLDYDVPIMLWCILVYQRVVFSHWWMGLTTPVQEEQYYDFYREVARRTPPENLMRWDFKKHGWEDLCKFLEVKDCPRSGELEHAPNVNSWDKVPWEDVTEPCMLFPLFLLLHWVNWKVYGLLLMAPLRLCRRLCGRAKAD